MKIRIECSAFQDPMGVVKAHVEEGINRVTMIDLELASRAAVSNEDVDGLIGAPIKLLAEDVLHQKLPQTR